MSDFLWQSYNRLINELEITSHRYLYQQFQLDSRLVGIIGPRGVGKTTLLLQYIKNNLYDEGATFYFSADNTYFEDVSLLEFVDELYQQKDIRNFFIDEIHKYNNWNQELKNIYDSFPKAKVVFSGSSSMDLVHGSYDLSRRAKLIYMPGLSFREYLNLITGNNFPVIGFDDLIADHIKIAAQLSQVTTILKYFEDYKSFGYYPFVLNNRDDLYQTVANIIDKTIYEDIANFYRLKTTNLHYFRKIINFLATIPPGKVTANNIAKHLGVDNKTVDHYLEILTKTGVIKKLFPVAHGNQILTKPEKVYLDNTTLLAASNAFLSSPLDVGTIRELAFLQSLQGAGINVFYPKVGDFQVKDIIFEIGGKNKTAAQLKNVLARKYVVKDNIIVGSKSEIPLYLFGFLY